MISGKKIIKKAEELGIEYKKTYGWTFYHKGNEQKFIPPYKNLKAYNFLLQVERALKEKEEKAYQDINLKLFVYHVSGIRLKTKEKIIEAYNLGLRIMRVRDCNNSVLIIQKEGVLKK